MVEANETKGHIDTTANLSKEERSNSARIGVKALSTTAGSMSVLYWCCVSSIVLKHSVLSLNPQDSWKFWKPPKCYHKKHSLK